MFSVQCICTKQTSASGQSGKPLPRNMQKPSGSSAENLPVQLRKPQRMRQRQPGAVNGRLKRSRSAKKSSNAWRLLRHLTEQRADTSAIHNPKEDELFQILRKMTV